jgi:hypothetical protein
MDSRGGVKWQKSQEKFGLNVQNANRTCTGMLLAVTQKIIWRLQDGVYRVSDMFTLKFCKPTHLIHTYKSDNILHDMTPNGKWTLILTNVKWRNKMAWYVDIPKYDDDETWYNVDTFATREGALKCARECFGADEEGRIQLVTSDGEEE